MQRDRWILILSVSQELEELKLWSLKRQLWILRSRMALVGGRVALLGWEGGVHGAAGLVVGLRPGGRWFLAGEGEGLVG